MAKNKITAKGTEITIITHKKDDDYISLTDLARYKNPHEPKDVVANWLRVRNTIEYLGIWEQLNNPDFKGVEFDAFLHEAGGNAFTLSPQRWVESTGAIGITSKSGRGGGTFAHKDIAFKFAAWISVEFELYVIKDYQRLKADEQQQQSLEWNLQRTLSKINYRIHTDAIRDEIIPKKVTKVQAGAVYASEADMLNVALFGMTAGEWRTQNPDKTGNMRDYATLEQLVVLSNMESINGLLIRQGLPQSERLVHLNSTAITQMKSLVDSRLQKRLK
jgi:hypothetical protein